MDGLCLAAFRNPSDALLWSLRTRAAMLAAAWPDALLSHALGEEVSVPLAAKPPMPPPMLPPLPPPVLPPMLPPVLPTVPTVLVQTSPFAASAASAVLPHTAEQQRDGPLDPCFVAVSDLQYVPTDAGAAPPPPSTLLQAHSPPRARAAPSSTRTSTSTSGTWTIPASATKSPVKAPGVPVRTSFSGLSFPSVYSGPDASRLGSEGHGTSPSRPMSMDAGLAAAPAAPCELTVMRGLRIKVGSTREPSGCVRHLPLQKRNSLWSACAQQDILQQLATTRAHAAGTAVCESDEQGAVPCVRAAGTRGLSQGLLQGAVA